MNLSTGRVLIIVALVVGGLAILANGFGDSGTTAAVVPSTTRTPSPSESGASPSASESASPTVTPSPKTKGVVFLALNGTDVTGAGAAAQDLLETDGDKAAGPAGDAPVAGVKKTTVYYRDDADAAQNESDATYIADQYFGGAPVKKLDPDATGSVPETATVVIVVGEDWASDLVA